MAVRLKRKLGDVLKAEGLITEDEIVAALEQKKPRQKLGDALVEQGYITEKQLIEVLEIQLNISSVSLYRFPINEQLMELVPKELARENILIPIEQHENTLTIAMNDPLDYYAIDDIELSTGFEVKPVIATKEDILQAINKYYDLEADFSMEGEGADAPAVKLLDQILQTGVTLRASDVHLDPSEGKIAVRYRIDGMLRNDRTLPKRIQNALIARVKILANLNITETRMPQDGRIRLVIDAKPIDLRVSTLPTVFGEKVVIRILDLTNIFKKLTEIDLHAETLKQYRDVISRPSGLVLLTGPTGSGKTTTLYSSINELNQEDVNIITVEDPVEYQLEGVNQVQVNSAVGLTFAAGLRSILRQDPNIIMVGEIRDRETAEIAIRSSLTGHVVFSTLHTNSAVDAIPRLFDMGVEPYLVVSSLTGVMAQRLVKRVCKDCKTSRPVTKMEQELFEKHHIDIDEVTEGAGCDSCRGTGYRGRMAIHELMVIDDQVKKLMMNNASMREIKDYVKDKGMHFLVDDGLLKVKEGLTTIEEVMRVAIDA
ncbi:type II secretion system protein E [Halolactibacillus miurensis]|uniref:Type II secretion system protein E n=1 Tax=Halolactibacillus miurensis TaxID=306541 RepID=A0A1I6PIV4_9BACI|nr:MULTISPECIES: ATPase, T2SS/T4P/T4SS family [Halolactibacillus]GEM03815.1 type II secretion system protein E [Halolactibacillus miurensis]SFS40171.1 type IV pilus assembly protein PilB [Halolactibacillus miurensis]